VLVRGLVLCAAAGAEIDAVIMAKSVHTYGVDTLQRVLRDLPDAVERTDINRATREAMRPVRSDARAKIKSDSYRGGSLWKSIKILTLKRDDRRQYGFMGGVMAGPDYRKAPHAHLVEFGTGMRYRRTTRLTAVSTGMMPASPFMRPAYEKNKRQILDTFRREYAPVLQKRIRRLVRRHGAGA